MLTLRVEADKALQELDAIPKRLRFALETALRQAAADVKQEMQRRAPVYTGQLRDSITVTEIDSLHYQVQPTVPYAEAVIGGDKRPELAGQAAFLMILAWTQKKMRALPNQPQRARAWAIMQRLRTKGAVPNPFVQATFELMESRILEKVNQAIERELG